MNFFVVLLNGRRFGDDSASCFLCCFTPFPVYRSSDVECTRQQPNKGLIPSNHRILRCLPPVLPPSMLEVLLSVFFLGSASAVSHPSSHLPLPPLFSFFHSPLLISLTPPPPKAFCCIPLPTHFESTGFVFAWVLLCARATVKPI